MFFIFDSPSFSPASTEAEVNQENLTSKSQNLSTGNFVHKHKLNPNSLFFIYIRAKSLKNLLSDSLQKNEALRMSKCPNVHLSSPASAKVVQLLCVLIL